jgi:hypothetical protein
LSKQVVEAAPRPDPYDSLLNLPFPIEEASRYTPFFSRPRKVTLFVSNCNEINPHSRKELLTILPARSRPLDNDQRQDRTPRPLNPAVSEHFVRENESAERPRWSGHIFSITPKQSRLTQRQGSSGSATSAEVMV